MRWFYSYYGTCFVIRWALLLMWCIVSYSLACTIYLAYVTLALSFTFNDLYGTLYVGLHF